MAAASAFDTAVALVGFAGLLAGLYLLIGRRTNVVASRPGP
jgi:hypothetical protein